MILCFIVLTSLDHNGAIEIGQSNVLHRIERRKNDLGRHIKRLENQLDFRKSQLNHHEQLEQLVTARVEETQEQDENWHQMMARGRQVYGDAWDNPSDGSIPLQTLMTMHKDELYAIRHEAQSKIDLEPEKKKKRKPKAIREAEAIEYQNRAILQFNQSNIQQYNHELMHGNKTTTRGLLNSQALVHPQAQWSSHRRRVPVTTQTVELDVEPEWTREATAPVLPALSIPRLDFTKLTHATGLAAREVPDQAAKASHRENRMSALNKLRKWQQKAS